MVLDQRLLPNRQDWVECTDANQVANAIVTMQVRGAPAIGAAAAYGAALQAKKLADQGISGEQFGQAMADTLNALGKTRPTAVNLFWAISRMERKLAETSGLKPAGQAASLAAEAEAIAEEDVLVNRRIGQHGTSLFTQDHNRILTHCNTGSLATVEYGTALGVIRALADASKLASVWVDETRPYLQGARLTAFELAEDGIPYTLITDSMAGHFMHAGQVDAVIVGADRIAANGDTANKIGTYSLAVLAKYHRVPFYVAAPSSTFDLNIASGDQIPIEQRDPGEVTNLLGQSIAPPGTAAAHPAFDVTPHELIAAIITEFGVVQPLTKEMIANTIGGRKS